MSHCESLPAISTPSSRVLILGSMPGTKSLKEAQYYALTHNAFWPIMSQLFDSDISSYQARMDLIKRHDLALWDVMKFCLRKGSLDSAIHRDSIEVNDFNAFLGSHPRITHIFFNGATAAKEFRKHVVPSLPEEILQRISMHDLPSTSPAHAGMTRIEKIEKWSAVRNVIS